VCRGNALEERGLATRTPSGVVDPIVRFRLHRSLLTRRLSPPIVERIQSFLDVSYGRSDDAEAERKGLNINQVLVNEYSPGQGISVRAIIMCCLTTTALISSSLMKMDRLFAHW